MQLATSAAAVPAIAFLPGTPASAASVDRSAWDAAVDTLKRVEAEYGALDQQHSAAFDAAEAECPREREFFSRYGMVVYTDNKRFRERNFQNAEAQIYSERLRAVRALGGRQYLTDEECEQVATEAHRVVERFEEWRRARKAAHERHNCDELERQFSALVDRRYDAQTAILETAAPDEEALVTKLVLLATMMDGEQDQCHVVAIRDDARRLLTVTH